MVKRLDISEHDTPQAAASFQRMTSASGGRKQHLLYGAPTAMDRGKSRRVAFKIHARADELPRHLSEATRPS
ncbi:hypothetical protein ACO9S2_00360 [Nitrospira sp. NS4]|uniref:hypothetical protein n=1 Tax=Nitrospira sp. NS4 TaxID=3414498 RepID=UPI003C2EA1FE